MVGFVTHAVLCEREFCTKSDAIRTSTARGRLGRHVGLRSGVASDVGTGVRSTCRGTGRLRIAGASAAPARVRLVAVGACNKARRLLTGRRGGARRDRGVTWRQHVP